MAPQAVKLTTPLGMMRSNNLVLTYSFSRTLVIDYVSMLTVEDLLLGAFVETPIQKVEKQVFR